jgi:valyl-tRNA synthetase
MNEADFPPRYDPKPIEGKWYQYWESKGLFRADNQSEEKAFTIVIPPPNITGSLHVGHALNNTLQDIQVRFKKLQGYETLWLPGMDHASIGTHTHLDRALAEEGKTRFDIGRDEFLKRAWAWKEKFGSRIIEQLKLLGCACDWSRTRFTMDEMLSKAVREAFCRYYEEGLIYRGTRIVNWCPRCHTAISDLEIKRQELNSSWWYIKYPMVKSQVQSPKSKTEGDETADYTDYADGNPTLTTKAQRHNSDSCLSVFVVKKQNSKSVESAKSVAKVQNTDYIVVATTRPETMLGDTAVAVHPDDVRYKSLVGKTLILPLVGREIPLIADELVAADFGTGAVKVTPAHDATDYEIGKKHGLAFIKVIDEDARMTEHAPKRYQGLTREECRKLVIQDLEAQGLMERIEPYHLAASKCERCGTIVEPMMSDQWFVRMKELAGPAIKAVENGRIKLIPERWTKVYLDWMYNIRDWCISRQLWWGLRLPVFCCEDCGQIIVAREDPAACPKCSSRKIRQDEDILDTWFSSALWPFSTMGWPDKTPDLAKFYPTDFLSTAPDIIFLWVARMIFSGLKFMGDIPFSRVYFHSFILIETGERMSRSKGIGLDPVELFEKYGTDAVRFTLAYLESQSQSYRLAEKRFEFGRNFTNKIWNAARLLHPFLRRRSGDTIPNRGDSGHVPRRTPPLLPVDKWIISRYNRTIRLVTDSIEACMYSAAAAQLYEFFWHELCDWYLEFAKPRMKAPDEACRSTLGQVFQGALQLLHPMMPFITEEVWQRFGFGAGDSGLGAGDLESIMVSKWPAPIPVDTAQADEVETMRELIVAIRNIRSEMNVAAAARVACLINTSDRGLEEFLLDQQALIAEQAKVSELRSAHAKPPHSSLIVLPGLEVYIPLEGLIDFDREQARIQKDLANAEAEITRIEQRLQDENFQRKAKPEVVERERDRLAALTERRTRLKRTLESL